MPKPVIRYRLLCFPSIIRLTEDVSPHMKKSDNYSSSNQPFWVILIASVNIKNVN